MATTASPPSSSSSSPSSSSSSASSATIGPNKNNVAAGSSATQSSNISNKVEDLTADMLQKLGAYFTNEIQASASEYELLAKLNKVASDRYGDMADKSEALLEAMHQLQRTYGKMAPYLQQIDELDANVQSLEAVTRRLDKYTLDLEAQFKKIYK